ncbi:MAG: hypothetical protein U0840_10620 [Gemmataceae bacterium]
MSSLESSPSVAPPGLVRRLARWACNLAVFLLVAWHLFFFAFRNPLDLWHKPIYAWLESQPGWDRWGRIFIRADDLTYRFANLAGCEQRWVMFCPPMARGAWFLGFRFEFADGSHAVLPSTNEPTPERFFRLGGWQIRKFEDHLCFPDDNLARNPELGLWEAYALEAVRRWKRTHPDDPRQIQQVVMIRRRIAFTGPEDVPGDYAAPRTEDIARFDAAGRLQP